MSNSFVPYLKQTIIIGDRPYNVSCDLNYVWVSRDLSNNITQLYNSTSYSSNIQGQIVRQISVTNPGAICSDGTNVWVSNKNATYFTQINCSTGVATQINISPSYGTFSNSVSFVSSNGTFVWLASSTSVCIFSCSSPTVQTALTIPPTQATFAMTIDSNYAWITNGIITGGNSSIYQCNINQLSNHTGSLIILSTSALPTGANPAGPIFSDGTSLWIPQFNDTPVRCFNINSLTIQGTVNGYRGSTCGLYSNGSNLWIQSNIDYGGGAHNGIVNYSCSTLNLIQTIVLPDTVNYNRYVSYNSLGGSSSLLSYDQTQQLIPQGLGLYASSIWGGSPDNQLWEIQTSIGQVPCYNENTKILCLGENSQDIYIPVQDVCKGTWVKTLLDGYKQVEYTGKRSFINDPTNWKNCMYVLPRRNEMIDDLIITGGHSILVDALFQNEEEIKKKEEYWGEEQYVIDDRFLVLAAVSKDFIQITNKEIYTVYHFVLDQNGDDDTKRYGVWANGVMSESQSKKGYLKCSFESA